MSTTSLNRAVSFVRRSAFLLEAVDMPDSRLLDRFLASRDEAAFEAIVKRHGGMVWGVCRRVLQGVHGTEDAFQATFLVLAIKAASVRPRSLVGNWLFGVAHKTALKARAMKQLRQRKEKRAGAEMSSERSCETDQYALELLDLELNRLPQHYRSALITCDLQGNTIKQAAQQHNCPQGTMAARLTRGRALLARRLAHRGLGIGLGALTAEAARAAAPPRLVQTTSQAVCTSATASAALTDLVSVSVVKLTEGVLKSMLLSKLKFGLCLLMVALLTGYGTASLSGPSGSGEPLAFAASAQQGRRQIAGKSASSGGSMSTQGQVALRDQDIKIEVTGVVQNVLMKPVGVPLLKGIPYMDRLFSKPSAQKDSPFMDRLNSSQDTQKDSPDKVRLFSSQNVQKDSSDRDPSFASQGGQSEHVITQYPWRISARGITFALDISGCPIMMDLATERLNGKTYLLKGSLEGKAESYPLFKVTSIEAVNRSPHITFQAGSPESTREKCRPPIHNLHAKFGLKWAWRPGPPVNLHRDPQIDAGVENQADREDARDKNHHRSRSATIIFVKSLDLGFRKENR
ncbi:hypothetical protein BH10PLA2_BH10PLA2_03330 [soil metagenome]